MNSSAYRVALELCKEAYDSYSNYKKYNYKKKDAYENVFINPKAYDRNMQMQKLRDNKIREYNRFAKAHGLPLNHTLANRTINNNLTQIDNYSKRLKDILFQRFGSVPKSTIVSLRNRIASLGEFRKRYADPTQRNNLISLHREYSKKFTSAGATNRTINNNLTQIDNYSKRLKDILSQRVGSAPKSTIVSLRNRIASLEEFRKRYANTAQRNNLISLNKEYSKKFTSAGNKASAGPNRKVNDLKNANKPNVKDLSYKNWLEMRNINKLLKKPAYQLPVKITSPYLSNLYNKRKILFDNKTNILQARLRALQTGTNNDSTYKAKVDAWRTKNRNSNLFIANANANANAKAKAKANAKAKVTNVASTTATKVTTNPVIAKAKAKTKTSQKNQDNLANFINNNTNKSFEQRYQKLAF